MRDLTGTAIERITDTVLADFERAEPVDPLALTFLLRRYGATDRADLREALEPGLARALDASSLAESLQDRAAWLLLFSESLTLSFDARLHETATTLAESLRRGWGAPARIDVAAVAVHACLRACTALPLVSMAPGAVDELERIVAASYRPGLGLGSHEGGGERVDAALPALVFLSSALLTAFELSGRLPYSMLAEELVQFARRTLWQRDGCFDAGEADARAAFRVNCEAARVLCRLAALHADDDYRAAAVIRADAAYADVAAGLLSALGVTLAERGDGSAVYGLALSEWLALG